MSVRSPGAATDRFLEPLQRVVSCLTPDVLLYSQGGNKVLDKDHTLALARAYVTVGQDRDRQLHLAMKYQIIKTSGPSVFSHGRYKISTRMYDYSIRDASIADTNESKLLMWHWHPETGVPFPHLHVRPGDKRLNRRHHIPTGRVSMESVVRFCVTELGTAPKRADWVEVLDACEEAFTKYRSWHR